MGRVPGTRHAVRDGAVSVAMSRRASQHSDLVRTGVTDVERTGDNLARLAEAGGEFDLPDLALAADPDRAVAVLAQIAPDNPVCRAVLQDPAHAARLLSLLGLSESLGDFLIRHPEAVSVLARDGIDGARERILAALRGEQAMLDLRVAYRRELINVAARDLCGESTLEQTMVELTALADAALQGCYELAVREIGEAAEQVDVAIIAMGKCGARELNYISDVDVVFIAEPSSTEVRVTPRCASVRRSPASDADRERRDLRGSIWEVDAALRPEGKAGALVRTIDSYVAYYTKWARPGSSRPCSRSGPPPGTWKLGARYVDAVSDFVWSAAARENFVDDVQAMRRRVEEHIPRSKRPGRSSSAAADCAMWSSPSRSCSWCMAAVTSHCARRPP